MKLTGNSLKWTAVIVVITLVLVFSGYFTGLLFSGKDGTEQINAQSPYKDREEAVEENRGPVSTGPSVPEENPADNRLTTGKTYGTRLTEDGAVNVLIIGEDKVSYLYDTIGIASINKSNSTMKLIMIPRDTYIEYNQKILDVLDREGKINQAGIFKINFAHHIGTMMKYEGRFNSGSISFLADVIEEKMGIEINDYVKVNINGFVRLVDLFGGIDINVPYNMHYDDPAQDLHIHLDKGPQHLDGSQAEGFVRFRQGLAEDGTELQIGDTGRKKNQINFLKEFIRQHGTLGNINKVPEMMKILGKNLQTSIGLGDMLKTYMGLAKDIIADKYEIESVNLDGKQIRINGSAYVEIE